MTTLKHRASLPASNHVLHSFVFADETERLAATLEPEDVGRVALQLAGDTNLVFFVLTEAPSTWVRIAPDATAGMDALIVLVDEHTTSIAFQGGLLGDTVDALDTAEADIVTNAATAADASAVNAIAIADNTAAILLARTYSWVWADAAARLGQTGLTSADLGAHGFQTDIAREYKLLALTGGAPCRWGELADSSLGPDRRIDWIGGTTTIHSLGLITNPGSGSQSTRGATGATRSTQLMRGRLDTTTAAGTVAYSKMAGNTFCPQPAGGYRLTMRAVLGAVSANERWFMGITDTIPTNVDPGVFLNSLGIGRNNEANCQLYCNDAAGVATQVDLGAGFPPVTVSIGYECQIYTFDGTSYCIQVRHLNTHAEYSHTFSTNVPDPTTGHPFMFTACNNTDSTNCSLDSAEVVWAQVTR